MEGLRGVERCNLRALLQWPLVRVHIMIQIILRAPLPISRILGTVT